MLIECRYDKENNIRYQVVTGDLVVRELIEQLRELYASDESPVQANVVWDLSGADAFPVTREQVRRLASYVMRAWGGSTDYRAAFIVGSDLTFGMTRMFEQLLDLFDDDNVKIFKSIDEAEVWIRS
jgi:hypothetical protein